MSDWIISLPNPDPPRVLARVRLFGVLGTWMEADIVASTIRNARRQGCERVYLVDNASPDDTVPVAEAEGAILARSFQTEHYDEHERLRHMNEVVAEVSAAEPDDHLWWLFLDADEFVRGPWGMTVLEYLRTLDERFRVVGARFLNHYPSGAPQSRPRAHPIRFQPLAEELSFPMCPSGHRKHPLQRYDRSGPLVESDRGFHHARCDVQLVEPSQPVFLHHFPFREEATTRRRLDALWAKGERGASRALEADDATGHMLPRHRSLDAVYSQDWARVENFIPPLPSVGVSLRPWTEIVEPEHLGPDADASLVGVWKYEQLDRYRYGCDTTYVRGMAFLDGHGTIEDWGCGFAHAREFVTASEYVGLDGSSPDADRIVDLTTYRSEADCIFMRHVLEHNPEWRRILAGAVASFRKRMVLVVFTPFVEETRIIDSTCSVTSVPVPDIAFRKEDLTAYFEGCSFTEETLETDTQYGTEHVFYLEKTAAGSGEVTPGVRGGSAPAIGGAPRPVVSVITIFHNEARFLEESIASVIAQTHPAWELLLVDDGSDDGSTEIARAAVRKDPDRVRYLDHPGHANLGMSASRNLGVAASRGEYVAFLDADDVWLAGMLERNVEALERRPDVDMVYGATRLWFSWTGRPEDAGRDCERGVGIPAGSLIPPRGLVTRCYPLGEANSPAMCSFVVRRSVLQRVGGGEPEFRGMFEDQVLLAKLYMNAAVLVTDDCLALYRVHPRSCVSTAVATGDIDKTTHRFLAWLQAYLAAAGIDEPPVRRAMRRVLRPYRHPRAFSAWSAARRAAVRVREAAWAVGNDLVRRVSGKSTARIAATPNPIRTSDRYGVGATILSWKSRGASAVEIRLGGPDGALVARSDPSGHLETGTWVSDGTRFYLQDVSDGRPLTAANTLAAVSVRVRGNGRSTPPPRAGR